MTPRLMPPACSSECEYLRGQGYVVRCDACAPFTVPPGSGSEPVGMGEGNVDPVKLCVCETGPRMSDAKWSKHVEEFHREGTLPSEALTPEEAVGAVGPPAPRLPWPPSPVAEASRRLERAARAAGFKATMRLPEDIVPVPAEQPVADARGELWNLGPTPLGSFLRITSKKGTVRGNHAHRREQHVAVLLSGRMRYHWQDVEGKHRSVFVGPWVAVYSGPGEKHAFEYLEDSVMVVFSDRAGAKDYEADIIRYHDPFGLGPDWPRLGAFGEHFYTCTRCGFKYVTDTPSAYCPRQSNDDGGVCGAPVKERRWDE